MCVYHICVQPHYMAPQVWQGQYDGACDLWSVGVVTYVLLSGTQPFPGASKQQACHKEGGRDTTHHDASHVHMAVCMRCVDKR